MYTTDGSIEMVCGLLKQKLLDIFSEGWADDVILNNIKTGSEIRQPVNNGKIKTGIEIQ